MASTKKITSAPTTSNNLQRKPITLELICCAAVKEIDRRRYPYEQLWLSQNEWPGD
ncbi:hypothetical protein MUCCIDRAFT_113331 [Mucor lusitanicus CBS 277.49]|uniref:Uncharacterized protein n=1 Tax=Mucor lusitanicus CBS 277.49 TaxID=747725 RepID=A0A162YPL2_MUCCL|nr:hypothetical protein MUCCIDRAFT_113331 [Mucor lusitanicus CBS 277.49]